LCGGWPADNRPVIRLGNGYGETGSATFAPDWEIVGRIQFAISGLKEPVCVDVWLPLQAMVPLARPTEQAPGEIRQEARMDPERGESVVLAAEAVTIDAVAELGGTELSVNEILGLKVGDVVRLDSKVTDDLPVFIQGERQLMGRPGVSRGQMAIQVSRFVEKE